MSAAQMRRRSRRWVAAACAAAVLLVLALLVDSAAAGASRFVAVDGPAEVRDLVVRITPEVPLAARACLYEMTGRVVLPAALNRSEAEPLAGLMYAHSMWYRGVRLPPSSFVNSFFLPMYAAVDGAQFVAYQMAPLPAVMALSQPFTMRPSCLTDLHVRTCSDTRLELDRTPSGRDPSDCLQVSLFHVMRALNTLPLVFRLCDMALGLEALAHAAHTLPMPLHLAVVTHDVSTLRHWLAIAAAAVCAHLPAGGEAPMFVFVDALEQPADAWLADAVQAFSDCPTARVLPLRGSTSALYDHVGVLGALMTSVRDQSVPPLASSAAAWLVDGGVLLAHQLSSDALPSRRRPFHEMLSARPMRLVARSRDVSWRTFVERSNEDLELRVELYRANAVNTRGASMLATVRVGIPTQPIDTQLARSYPQPARSVSVILPCLNCAASLPQTFASVIASLVVARSKRPVLQSEVVFVNDRSTDDSIDVLRRLRSEYAQVLQQNGIIVVAVTSEEQLGPGGARNFGVSMSSGDVLFFCDADDEFFEAHVDTCFSIVTGRPQIGFARGQVDAGDPNVDVFWKQALAQTLPLAHCVRRECYDRFGGFPEDFYWYKREDVWFARMLFAFCEGAQFYVETVRYHRSAGNKFDEQGDKFHRPIGEWYRMAESQEKSGFIDLMPIVHHVQRVWLRDVGEADASGRDVAWHSSEQPPPWREQSVVLESDERPYEVDAALHLGMGFVVEASPSLERGEA